VNHHSPVYESPQGAGQITTNAAYKSPHTNPVTDRLIPRSRVVICPDSSGAAQKRVVIYPHRQAPRGLKRPPPSGWCVTFQDAAGCPGTSADVRGRPEFARRGPIRAGSTDHKTGSRIQFNMPLMSEKPASCKAFPCNCHSRELLFHDWLSRNPLHVLE